MQKLRVSDLYLAFFFVTTTQQTAQVYLADHQGLVVLASLLFVCFKTLSTVAAHSFPPAAEPMGHSCSHGLPPRSSAEDYGEHFSLIHSAPPSTFALIAGSCCGLRIHTSLTLKSTEMRWRGAKSVTLREHVIKLTLLFICMSIYFFLKGRAWAWQGWYYSDASDQLIEKLAQKKTQNNSVKCAKMYCCIFWWVSFIEC